MKIDTKILLCLTGACMGVMNLLPWGGPVARAATVLSMDANDLWHILIPIQIVGLIFNIVVAVLLGMLAIKQGAGAGKGEKVEQDQKTKDEEIAFKKTKTVILQPGSNHCADRSSVCWSGNKLCCIYDRTEFSSGC